MRKDSPAGATVSAAETAVHVRTGTLTLTAPPSEAGRSVTIGPRGTVVGRGVDADLGAGSEHLSRRHFVVRNRAGGYEVEDLGSRNGTLLNDDPVTGIRRLRDGDHLSAGGVEVEFSLAPWAQPPGRRSAPYPGGSWHPDEETRASGREPIQTDQRSLGRELHAAASFSGQGLLLAVLGSVVGTVLAGAASAGPWGTLASAAVTPVVSSAFATRRAGDRGHVAAAAIVLLSAAALVITVTGVSLADLANGKSVLPGNGSQSGTFPGVHAKPAPDPGSDSGSGSSSSSSEPPSPSSSTPGQPGPISAEPVNCGTVEVGSTATCPAGAILVYRGEGSLKITRVEIVGEAAGDYVAGSECVGRTLQSGSNCETGISFTASAAGPRKATLIIHQSLPAPDRGTSVELAGVGHSSSTDPSCGTDPAPTDSPTGADVCVLPSPSS
jgi:pSer/pThr/pTyr-binding forkhead associated (FHA) protein